MTRITEFSEIISASPTDIIYLIHDPDGNAEDKKIRIYNLIGSILYSLDTQPSSPSSYDDEFSGSSLDPKWTNPATSTRTSTISFNGLSVSLEPSDAGTGSTGARGGWGIRQDSPTGSFTVMAKIYNQNGIVGTDDGRAGIFIANTSGSVGNILGYQSSAGRIANATGFTYYEDSDWGTYDGYDGFTTTPVNGWVGTWYRISWDSSGSTIYFYYSTDGNTWSLLNTRGSMSQPDRMGIAIWGNNADIKADHSVKCVWFRVTEP